MGVETGTAAASGGEGRVHAHGSSGTSGGKVRRGGAGSSGPATSSGVGTSTVTGTGASSGGGTGRKNSRPRKKARATTPPPTAPTHGNTPATAQGLDVEVGRSIPENMHEYREGCLRLEKVRHEKVYQAQKRLLYTERMIEQAYQLDVSATEEAFNLGVQQLMERMLMDNLARKQRLEEERWGVAHRPSEATLASGLYGNGARPHGMALRTRNGSGAGSGSGAGHGGIGNPNGGGSGDEKTRGNSNNNMAANENDSALPPVDGGRTSRRSRKEARNGNNNSNAQPRVRLQMALDPEAVDADLAKIARGKRSRDDRDHNINERRSKKRK